MANKQSAKIAKMRELTVDEARIRAAELLRDMFDLRIKAETKELVQTHQLRERRREYAQLMTVLNERRRKAAGSAK